MAVFTTVERAALERLLADYDIGTLTGLEGIATGVVNTNYFVTTTAGHYVLTLFERLADTELPWFLALMEHLSARGCPCPRPVADRSGRALQRLAGRPAALVTRLPGASVEAPTQAHCEAVGEALARLHAAGEGFQPVRANPHDAGWAAATAGRLAGAMPAADRALAAQGLECMQRLGQAGLPRGLIHADLFRDNVLFTGGSVSGIIDLYYACHDALILDLAITATDWCRSGEDTLDATRLDALLRGYAAVRAPLPAERAHWPAALLAAGLRFWLSRLQDWHHPREGELVAAKDPADYRRLACWLARARPAWPV